MIQLFWLKMFDSRNKPDVNGDTFLAHATHHICARTPYWTPVEGTLRERESMDIRPISFSQEAVDLRVSTALLLSAQMFCRR